MDTNATLHTMYSYTVKITLLILLINVAFCIFQRKKLNIPFKRLLYFLIWNLFIETLAFICIKLEYNNLPLLHIYTLGEFLLLSYFFKVLVDKPTFLKKGFTYFIVAGSLFIIANSVFFQPIFGFNTFAKTFVQVIIISYAILYFYNLVENPLFSLQVSKSLRLVNSAILVYYSGSLFIFMCSNVYLENMEIYVPFWAFNALLNFLFQLLILVGLWNVFYKKKVL